MNDIHIYLIRHGESVVNASGLDQIGQANDTPLTLKGIEQAHLLGKRLAKLPSFDFIASSPYKRAYDTANIVASEMRLGGDIPTTDALVEYDPGQFRGKRRSDVYKDQKNLMDITYQNMSYLFPGGETYHRVARRAMTYIEDAIIYNGNILDLAKNKEVNTILFSHGMTTKCILHSVLGFSESMLWKIRIENTSITHLRWNDKGWFVNTINDTGHLL